MSNPEGGLMKLVMFSKMLREFDVAGAARRIRELGFAGVDLTVRPGGHVEPEAVDPGLSVARRAIEDAGLELAMISTAITTVDSPNAERLVASAATQGVWRIKLGYWNARAGHLAESIDTAQRSLDALEKLADSHGVTFGIHNHSGSGYVNCQPAVIWMLLKDRDPNRVGAYFDPGHAVVEGADGGWRQGFEMLAPYLRMVAIKDFGFVPQPAKPKAAWIKKNMPLSEGLVPWGEFFAGLKRLGFDGPVSFHSEYEGSGSWKNLSTEALIEQTAVDLAFARTLIGPGS
jgi:sugar phosphate isomerase/epimerase